MLGLRFLHWEMIIRICAFEENIFILNDLNIIKYRQSCAYLSVMCHIIGQSLYFEKLEIFLD